MKPTITFGSLFAGIGGIDLGLERAGMECAWQVEIDPYAQKVLAKHWPNVRRYSDVKECGSDNLDPVDLICGGFPCQDISYAGKGAGIEGARSGLWKEYYRIICELRPRFVLVENVTALLGRGLDVVLGDLAACGYDAEWESLPAAAFGAPHRRDRIFIIAHANSGSGGSEHGKQQEIFSEKPNRVCKNRSSDNVAHPESEYGKWPKPKGDQGRQSQGTARNGSSDMADANIESAKRVAESRQECTPWETEPDVGRVANGVPSRVDRLRCLGNAVVPQVAEWVGRRIYEMIGDE